MITKKDVIEFFDRCAPGWDANQVCSDKIINIILDHAGVTVGKTILDVACGTGVMIPYYLERGVTKVTGIDISPNMAKIAREKFHQENIQIVCGDVEETNFEEFFDCIVVYNAFPHFPDPKRLLERLAELLRPGGTLTIGHGASRETIDSHHKGFASKVSMGLMPAEELAAMFPTKLEVITQISDDEMYQVTGVLYPLDRHGILKKS